MNRQETEEVKALIEKRAREIVKEEIGKIFDEPKKAETPVDDKPVKKVKEVNKDETV